MFVKVCNKIVQLSCVLVLLYPFTIAAKSKYIKFKMSSFEKNKGRRLLSKLIQDKYLLSIDELIKKNRIQVKRNRYQKKSVYYFNIDHLLLDQKKVKKYYGLLSDKMFWPKWKNFIGIQVDRSVIEGDYENKAFNTNKTYSSLALQREFYTAKDRHCLLGGTLPFQESEQRESLIDLQCFIRPYIGELFVGAGMTYHKFPLYEINGEKESFESSGVKFSFYLPVFVTMQTQYELFAQVDYYHPLLYDQQSWKNAHSFMFSLGGFLYDHQQLRISMGMDVSDGEQSSLRQTVLLRYGVFY